MNSAIIIRVRADKFTRVWVADTAVILDALDEFGATIRELVKDGLSRGGEER